MRKKLEYPPWGSFIVGRIKFTCQTLLRDGGQEVYSFLCLPLWEESD